MLSEKSKELIVDYLKERITHCETQLIYFKAMLKAPLNSKEFFSFEVKLYTEAKQQFENALKEVEKL